MRANGVIHHARTTKADNIFGGVEDPQGQRNGIRFEGTDGWIWVVCRSLDNWRARNRSLLLVPKAGSLF